MDTLSTYGFVNLFSDIDDLLNNYVDRIELEPILVNNNIYITGFRRPLPTHGNIELHFKEINKLNLDGIDYWMAEPINDMWINAMVLSDTVLKTTYEKFAEQIQQLTQFHTMLAKYKDEGDLYSTIQLTMYANKKAACKDALAMRKKHKEVTHTFETYDAQGQLISSKLTQQKEPTDFELVTCKVE